jgi:membrane protease YdiL (CAAX protease family)
MSARSLVRSHPMASFFVLAYVLAWAWLPFGSFGAFSPLLAALVVVPMADGRAGLRRLAGRVLHWRVRWYWYLAAVAVPLGAIAGAAALTVALGAPAPALAQLHPWYGVPLAFAMAMVNPLGGPLGEEPGWRGFAQPGLQATRSPLAATAIMAVLVTGWHAPLMMAPFNLRPVELLGTAGVTVWYAWLFNRSGGSALLTLVGHAADSSVETSTLWSGADAGLMVTLWCALLCGVAAVVLATDWRFWRGARPTPRMREPAVRLA